MPSTRAGERLADRTSVGTSSTSVFPFSALAKRSNPEHPWLVGYALERLVMETVYISPLSTLRLSLRRRLYEAEQEAARVWTL